MRQRFRWSFGILQAVWKHGAAIRQRSRLGWIALPNIIIFQIMLPLVSPFIDIMFLFGMLEYAAARYFHPESTDPSSFERLAFYFVIFLAIDFVASALAFLLERRVEGTGEDAQSAAASLAATVLLPPALFRGAGQDGEARHRWQAFRLGQT